MSHQQSQRMADVQTPMIPVVGEWIAKNPGTISLGQGVVHYPSPPSVAEAVVQAAGDRRMDCYALVRGIDEFLREVERKLAAENGIDTEQQTAVVTAGSNMGFLNAVLAIGDVGDEIILLAPYYFNHEMAIDIAGCRPVIVDTDAEYQIDRESLLAAISSRTRAIVTVSPNNPTGAVYSAESLTQVNRLCRERGIYHISDEAYEYFVYGDQKHFSPGSLSNSADHTISLYTLSKAYGMAGWRCGYMSIPKQLEVAVKKIQDTNLVCPPIINQIAATAAMKAGMRWCTDQIAGFERVRDLVLSELTKLGDRCHVPKPDGGFYALMKLETAKSDMEIVEVLIRDFGVAVMPGSTFGVGKGCSLRIAYGALDEQTVVEGMGRLTRGLSAIL